jgi:hypothetical protein
MRFLAFVIGALLLCNASAEAAATEPIIATNPAMKHRKLTAKHTVVAGLSLNGAQISASAEIGSRSLECVSANNLQVTKAMAYFVY